MHSEIRVCCTGKALIRLALLSEHPEKRLKLSSKLQARSYFKAYSCAEVFKEKSAATGGGWDGMGWRRGRKARHSINGNQPRQAGQQTLGLIREELSAMLRLRLEATSTLGR